MKNLSKITSIIALLALMVCILPSGAGAKEYEAPVFGSAQFTNETFEKDEPVSILVQSQPGETEMNTVWVQIQHEETGRLFWGNSVPYSKSGTLVSIQLPTEAPPGKYVVQAVSLTDKAGVRTETFNPGASTNVVGEPVDTVKPEFIDAEFEKKQYQPGEEVVLRIEASDDESGIDWVYASIQHLVSKDYTFRGFSNEVDGYHEVRFQLPTNALNGEYGIQYLTLSDRVGNETNVFDAAATFTVIGGSDDTEPPTLRNITIEKPQYKQGEQVHINIDAVDESGVKSVYLYVRHKETGVQYNAFATNNGESFDFSRDLPLNAPLGEYEVFAVYLEDNLGNQTNLFNYQPRIEFEVIE
ncbi:hypothetical protein RKD55_004588 [Rossellomorea marisflavi]